MHRTQPVIQYFEHHDQLPATNTQPHYFYYLFTAKLAGFLNGWLVLYCCLSFYTAQIIETTSTIGFSQLTQNGHFTDVLDGFCGLSEHELQGKPERSEIANFAVN